MSSGRTRPAAWAKAAASVRVLASSLVRIRDTWTLAVLGEMNSREAIARLVAPTARRHSTSRSRCVSAQKTRWTRALLSGGVGIGRREGIGCSPHDALSSVASARTGGELQHPALSQGCLQDLEGRTA